MIQAEAGFQSPFFIGIPDILHKRPYRGERIIQEIGAIALALGKAIGP